MVDVLPDLSFRLISAAFSKAADFAKAMAGAACTELDRHSPHRHRTRENTFWEGPLRSYAEGLAKAWRTLTHASDRVCAKLLERFRDPSLPQAYRRFRGLQTWPNFYFVLSSDRSHDHALACYCALAGQGR